MGANAFIDSMGAIALIMYYVCYLSSDIYCSVFDYIHQDVNRSMCGIKSLLNFNAKFNYYLCLKQCSLKCFDDD